MLIVDDEPLVRMQVRRMLAQQGFTLEEAPNASSGLEAIRRTLPDVVLLDMMMPDLDGVEVVRRLRASGVNVPIVLCSGDPEAARARGLEPGLVQCILQKPFDGSQLLEAIGKALGR